MKFKLVFSYQILGMCFDVERKGQHIRCTEKYRKVRITCIRYITLSFARLRPSLKFVHWNREGWKTGLCSVPPLNQVCFEQ